MHLVYKQGAKHLSDWTGSNISLLKFRSVVWLTLFLGSFQRCRAWDPQDPCQSNLANAALPRDFTLLSEYAHCIVQDSTCQDMPVPCNEMECNAEFDITEWLGTLYGHSMIPHSDQFRMMLVSSACPLTCKVCGPRKGERHVKPLVAAILRGPCQHGWSYADCACFKYSYKEQDGVSSHLLDWFSAENACQAEGAHLATVTSKAQEHLVFSLVGQHPSHLGRKGVWAWIGLSTQCSHNSDWSWIGAPQLNISSSPLYSLTPRGSQAGSTGKSCAAYTHSRQQGKTFGVSSRVADKTLRAWVCSKPALFHPVTVGRCQDVGLAPIHDLEACEAAFKVLMGMDSPAFRIQTTTRPIGCHVSKAWIGPEMNTDPGAHAVSAGSDRMLLCQSTNGTSQAAVDPGLGLTGQWEGVRANEVPPSFSQPLLVTLLVASVLPAFVVLAVRRRDVIALKGYLLLLVSQLLTHMCTSKPGASDPSIIVATRLQQKRRTIANIAAVAVAAFHLFELVRICLVEESVCTSATADSQLRLFLALVHLGSLWVASTFLALTNRIGQHSSRPDLVFFLAVVALDVVQMALVGEQALLVESRLYRQLLWRLLLGASTSPVVVLAGSVLHLIGVCAVYKALIPDGFIFTVGSTRAGLLYHQGCNQLWSQADAVSGKDLLIDMSRLSGLTDVSARHSLKALLDELLKKQTSFNDFLLSEIVLVAIVMACLVFLNTLVSKEISKSLRLQVSEDQLQAVSQVMDNLCDATCQLSCDLKVCGRARKLSTILKMSPSGPSSLEGADFCGVIAGEDECTGFRAFVQRGIRDGFKEPHYLNLKGAANTQVRMQVLSAHFMDALGLPRVLCGFTELQAGRHDATETGGTDTFGPLVPVEPRRQSHRQHRAARGSSSGSSSSSSRSASSGSSSSRRGSTDSRGGGSRRRNQEEKGPILDVRLDDDLSVVRTNQALVEFLGVTSQDSASLKPFLAEPEASAELLKGCVQGVSLDDFGASSARAINIVFNTRSPGSQGHGFSPRQAACRATPHLTLQLELLQVDKLHHRSPGPSAASGHGGEGPPVAGPRSLGRSLADRCLL